MKKRIIAAVLGAVMALSLVAPAIAGADEYGIMPISLTPVPYGRDEATATAETSDEALARVTLAVKGALGIEDEYTEFSGSSSKTGALNYWSLSWSCDDSSLYVRADDNGKVLSYNYYDDHVDTYVSWSNWSPFIPANTREAALEAAQEFVAPLLDESESIEWNKSEGVRELSRTSYYLYGTLLINDVPSPISVSASVRSDDLTVTRFNRTDSYSMLLPDVPSAEATADKDAAAEGLKGAYTLELQYVLDDDMQPVLRYTLATQKQLLVDAKTGEVIDVQELMRSILDGGYTAGVNATTEDAVDEDLSDKLFAANAPMAAPTLSPVEQQAVDKLIGVLSVDELETAARGMADLGITDKFLLASSSYSQVSYAEPKEGEEESDENVDVFATLRFVRERKDTESDYTYFVRTSKTVQLDAKTGEFINISGYSNEPTTLDVDTLAAGAEAFAKAHAEHFDEYKLYDQSERTFCDKYVVDEDDYTPTYFTYYRCVNGVPFKNDCISVSMDGSDGTVVSFSCGYTEDLEFPNTDDIIDMDAALDAYFGAYDVELSYSQLPIAVTPDDPRPLCADFANAGYSYVYELRLTYSATLGSGWLLGVDAKTGEALLQTSEPRTGITYEDIEDSYAAEVARTLGEYGVGYVGGKLLPESSLTQLDMICLLLSVDGYEIPEDPSDEEIEWLYQSISWRGISFEEHKPAEPVTRAEFVRSLVGMTTYGEAAKLEGIWAPGFKDDAEIAPSDIGYIAIARALGLVRGDTDGCFHPTNGISRQDALIVLYNYMTR